MGYVGPCGLAVCSHFKQLIPVLYCVAVAACNITHNHNINIFNANRTMTNLLFN